MIRIPSPQTTNPLSFLAKTSENLSNQKYSNKIKNLMGPNSGMERAKRGIYDLEEKNNINYQSEQWRKERL